MEPKSRLDGHDCVITGATGIAAAAAHRFVTGGAAATNALICIEFDAGSHHGWAAAHLFDEPAAVTAFETLVERIGFPTDCSEWPVADGRRFGDGPTDAVSLESRHGPRSEPDHIMSV